MRTSLLGVLCFTGGAEETDVAAVSVLPVDRSLSVEIRDESEVQASELRPVMALRLDSVPPVDGSLGRPAAW